MSSSKPRPISPREVPALRDLMDACFSPNESRWRENFPDWLRQYPNFRGLRLDLSRSIWRGGRIVASVAVYERNLRIGRALVRTCGVGGVGCLEDFRRHGYAAECMEAVLEASRKDGMTFSLLHGIERYYQRFGFAGCMPYYQLKLPVAALKDLKAPLKVAPWRAGWLKSAVEFYNLCAKDTPGAEARTADVFTHAFARWNLHGAAPNAKNGAFFAFVNPRKPAELRAYLVWKNGALSEAAYDPDDGDATSSLLAWMRDQRQTAVEKYLYFDGLCAAHPLWRYARRYNHTAETRFTWSGGWMGKVLDVKGFIELLKPEFESRLTRSGLECEGHALFTVDGGQHALLLNRAHHLALSPLMDRATLGARVTCTQQTLLQLVLGTQPWDAYTDLKVDGERALMRVLFPESTPHLYPLDAF